MPDPAAPPADGDDDWVKQVLAEAMLSGGIHPADSVPTPAADAGPAEDPEPDVAVEPGVAVEPDSVPTPAADAGPAEEPEPDVAVEPGVAVDTEPPVEAVDPDVSLSPEPAASSRLFERPAFDATNDPGVDAILSAEANGPPDELEAAEEEHSTVRSTVEWLIVLGSAVVVALILRAFLFQAFYIPSASMEETLLINDRVLVNKLSYRLHDINRGDIVVFRRPENDPGEFEDLIKRVIGLPGETIEARNNTIYINGQALIEPYLTAGEIIGDFDPVTIPEGELFVMGDNRDNSGDSRLFGTIDEDRVTGRAFFLFWPFSRAGSL